MVLHLFLEARPAQTGVVWPAGLYRGQVKLPLSKVDPDVADADKALVSPRFEFAVQEANNLQSQLATAAHKGMRFLLQGNPQRAEEACQEMLRLYPSSMEARAGIAQARYDQGDYERAQGSWEEALRLLLEGRDEFIPEHSRSIDDIAARFRFKIGKCQERRGKVAGAKDDE
jgi:tetratricopeptide (TPR) repeat protein